MFTRPRKGQLAIDISVAAVLFLISLPFSSQTVLYTFDEPSAYNWLGGVTATVLLCGAVAGRRVQPALALGVAWVGAILQMACLLMPSIVDVAAMIVVFTSAAYGTRRAMWMGLVSALLGAITAGGYLALVIFSGIRTGETVPWHESVNAEQWAGLVLVMVSVFAIVLILLGASWGAGVLVRLRLRAQAAEQERVVAEALAEMEHQRVRIARDMHDVVAHSLAVVIAQADGARYAARTDPEAATASLQAISTTARAALADVRLLLTQLRHAQAVGPQPGLADLDQLYAHVRAAGVDLQVEVDPPAPEDVSAAVALAIYRILQEALTNALRHGSKDLVAVAIAWHPDHVTVHVRNRVARPSTSSGGHGLVGMRERAQLVGGTLAAGETEDGWFVVDVFIPRSTTVSKETA